MKGIFKTKLLLWKMAVVTVITSELELFLVYCGSDITKEYGKTRLGKRRKIPNSFSSCSLRLSLIHQTRRSLCVVGNGLPCDVSFDFTTNHHYEVLSVYYTINCGSDLPNLTAGPGHPFYSKLDAVVV
jgi:hypothetical protein